MIVIAESGSTKTYWVLLENGVETLSFTSLGINPYTQKASEIEVIISKEVAPVLKEKAISTIYFYGASCSSNENKAMVSSAINKFLPDIKIEVEHDVMACAIGLFGKKKGIACILGTGSNSCFYDGYTLFQDNPALGYILGDEGSGAWLGKRLLRDFLYHNLPDNLYKILRDEKGLDKESILNKVYKEPAPNRWLASFAPLIKEHIEEEYCLGIVKESFHDFFRYHIDCFYEYKKYPVGVVGSIGYHFSDILRAIAIEYDYKLEKIIQSPMEGLIEFHSLTPYPSPHGEGSNSNNIKSNEL